MLPDALAPAATSQRPEILAYEPRTASLKPAPRLERRVDGKLWLDRDGSSVPVEVVRCCPWSAPGRLLSLRDAGGEEVAFVADPTELDAKSRAALAATLARSGFVLEITRIFTIQEDFELRSWRVETAGGARLFQTPLDAWPQRLDNGEVVVEDVHGDLYRVSDLHALDAKSQKLLSALVD